VDAKKNIVIHNPYTRVADKEIAMAGDLLALSLFHWTHRSTFILFRVDCVLK